MSRLLPLTGLLFAGLASSANGYSPLVGIKLVPVRAAGAPVDLGKELASATSNGEKAVCILGTYAADFNAIEYAQRIRHYLPKLRARGVGRVLFVVNGTPEAARKLGELCDLPADVELVADEDGFAGRRFGVSEGWRPDDAFLPPYAKLFGMLFGFGAWATLPAVIGGYIGNPYVGQPWIEDALAQGQRAGRWPDTALVLDGATGDVKENKFAELPVVGAWPRRPLELATLRLQNMVDISIKHWDELRPTDEHLSVLTQLGGLLCVGPGGEVVFEHKDPGICAVCNFEDFLAVLDQKAQPLASPSAAASA
jgi:hypothetical protein